jgi:hypothetical protein
MWSREAAAAISPCCLLSPLRGYGCCIDQEPTAYAVGYALARLRR